MILSIVSLSSLLHAQEISQEEKLIRRVYDHLLIEDDLAAVREAKEALKLFPLSKPVHFSLIDALSAQGQEVEAWQCWQNLDQLFPEAKKDRHLLETMAWGVLSKGEDAVALPIRLNSLIGAALTRDVKAIPLLLRALKSSSAPLRSIAVKLATSYADQPLKEELFRLLKEEKVWYVRLEVIRAIGHLRPEGAAAILQEILCNPKTLLEEKAESLLALVHIYEAIPVKNLETLTKSNRAALRELGAALILHLDDPKNAPFLLPLLRDTSFHVREQALTSLGFLRIQEIQGKSVVEWVLPLLQDSHPSVAITAAWNFLLLGDARGEALLKKWLQSENEEMQRLASAALRASGPYGTQLALHEMRRAEDPYVRVNLALGLIGQRVSVQESAALIGHTLEQMPETLWMWDRSSHPLFQSLAPSRIHHAPEIPHYPAVVDQMTRLELLSMLSIAGYPQAKTLMRDFLKKKSAFVMGAAAMTLLQEGDEEDFTSIEALLEDSDSQVRIQAALILGIFGGNPKAVKVLQGAYPEASREMKVHILEALAHIGSQESIPFLLEIFKEPFQLLRVVAASALIQCLYH